ncbi:TolC family protein [Caulobacter segnis]|uniref:TolC family protein n=1 Tax=Caulobacter TaxID=75 RepID=UPI0022B6AA35|nr:MULTISPECIES: TolC family protein [Caulobacter]MDG2522135.1 TolC family protein [Caulobacter segnis]
MSSVFRRPPRFAAGCAWIALATALTSPAWAEPAPPFQDLLKRLDQTPAAQEAAALQDAAEGRLLQARARPNPTLGLDAENVLGRGAYSGFNAAETTLSVSQQLELWGRRGIRIDAARAEAGAAARRRDLAAFDAAGRLALVYAEAEAAQRRYLLADEALSLTEADTKAARLQVEEGREPALRGVQAQSQSAAAAAARDEALAERDAAFARLRAVALLAEPVTSVEVSLLDLSPAQRGDGSSTPPSVQVAEAERLAAERAIAVERVRAMPDITANVGVRRFEVDDTAAVVFGVSMPLPLFDRNRGNLRAAQAEYRAADARLSSARQDAAAGYAAASARLRASSSRVQATDVGVATAQEAYRLSRIGFEAGRISQLELRTTRSALIDARTTAVEARLTRVRAEIDLARLEGRAPYQGSSQ